MKHAMLGVLLALLALNGCIGSSSSSVSVPTRILEASTETPVPSLTPSATTLPSPPPGPADIAAHATAVPAQAQVLAGIVIADLGGTLGVAADEISLEMVESVIWPGLGLGCAAEPDDNGTPAEAEQVNGFRIVLSFQNAVYEYHTDENNRFVACTSDMGSLSGEPVILDTYLSSMVDLARRNLANRLDLPLRRVFVVEAEPVEWPNGSVGCALDDQQYEPTAVPGYRIVLRVGREQYEYHSNLRQVIFCPEDAIRLPAVRPTPTATAPESS